ncbi:MAG: efflux RND transporter periplasmic adaptor subunit [Acetobacteraceae bacterium]
MRLRRVNVLAGAMLVVPLLLLGCKQQNHYVAPPPPEVGVATPLRKNVTLYLELTGNVVSINEVNLVARVPGFLTEINYKDGAYVTKGTNLFVIEPPPYQAKQQQAQGQLAAANAELVQAQAEFVRQSELASQNFASQSKLDVARAKRDSDQAIVQQDEANLAVAAINLSYTHVNAPFDGVVTTHLQAVGALVGQTGPTKLASIISLEPIYVTFNVAEQDVLKIRAAMQAKGLTLAKLGAVPIDVGLANEIGYPHHGVLDYVSPNVDPATGTLMVRARFANPNRELLPGYFVRVRVPEGKLDNALLIPDTAWGTDQQGSYVMVLGAGNKVEQRRVTLGQQQGALRIITAGLEPSDKVIVGGNSRAIPGQVVAPKATMIAEASPAGK